MNQSRKRETLRVALGASNERLSVYCPHIPSTRQREFLSLGVLEAMYGGRANCGKSDVLLMGALQGISIPAYSALILRRTYKELTKPGALLHRARSWFLNSPARWHDESSSFVFPSGASICFGYFDCDDDFGQFKSSEFQYIAIEEGSEFEPDHIRKMFGRLRRTRDFPDSLPLRFRIATNPGGPAHDFLRKRYGIEETDRFPEGSPAKFIDTSEGDYRVFFPAHPKDNPGCIWEEYRRSLAELPPITRLQWEDGIWIQDTDGRCYPNHEKARRVPRLPEGHQWSRGLSIDIGASNNCALAGVAWCADLPETFCEWTSEPTGLDTPRDLANQVKLLDSRDHYEFIVGDHGALGKGYLNEMRKWFQIPIINAEKNDKAGYIKLLDGAYANQMAVIVEGACESLDEQSKALLWKDAQQKEEKPGMRNHSCDAFLYAWRRAHHYSHEPKDETIAGMDDLELKMVTGRNQNLRQSNRIGMRLPEGYR
jgi:hypothetical protein